MTDHPSPLADASQSEALPGTALLRAHAGHMLGVLDDGLLVCDTCESEVPVLDRHFIGDDCTEEDGEHFAALAARSSEPPASPAPHIYLPMDCPVCGRHRVEWDGTVLRCEKCTTSSEWDGFSSERYAASTAPASPDEPDLYQWTKQALLDTGFEVSPWDMDGRAKQLSNKIAEARAASASVPPLDVERLKAAIRKWRESDYARHIRGHAPDSGYARSYIVPSLNEDMADGIAAAYAAETPEQPASREAGEPEGQP